MKTYIKKKALKKEDHQKGNIRKQYKQRIMEKLIQKKKRYVSSLEDKLERIEKLLSKIVTEKDEMLNTENDNSSVKTELDQQRKRLKGTTNTSNIDTIRKTYKQRSEKRQFKDMFNRLLFPIKLQMQFDTHSNRIQLDQIESVDYDTKIDSVEDSISLGLVQPNETINDIEYWIWKVAGIGKDLSDRLLKM